MESAIITVKRQGDIQGRDLEIPMEMTAGVLIQELALTLGWGDQYKIYVIPQERFLLPDETLAQAEVWDGATFIFQPSSQVSGSKSSNPQPPASSPVGGWRSLKPKKVSS